MKFICITFDSSSKTEPRTSFKNEIMGADVIRIPNIASGNPCIVSGNSLINNPIYAHSIIGGNSAKLIRKLTKEEINKTQQND